MFIHPDTEGFILCLVDIHLRDKVPSPRSSGVNPGRASPWELPAQGFSLLTRTAPLALASTQDPPVHAHTPTAPPRGRGYDLLLAWLTPCSPLLMINLLLGGFLPIFCKAQSVPKIPILQRTRCSQKHQFMSERPFSRLSYI